MLGVKTVAVFLKEFTGLIQNFPHASSPLFKCKNTTKTSSLGKLSYGGLFFWIKLFIPEVHIYRDANLWKSKFSPEFQLQNYDMGMD